MININIIFKAYKKHSEKALKVFEFADGANVFEIMSHCCNEFDLPTPVILEKHNRYFAEMFPVKFFNEDFLESIPYDALEIEIFEEDENKK
ncbi:MAG: hypothetical protein IJR47_04475 [Clostridia bacterium]|nr:hypothetical protein [Clostridia bacterium]